MPHSDLARWDAAGFGFFNAYEQLAKADDLDFIVHVGDYIYEVRTPDVGAGRLHSKIFKYCQSTESEGGLCPCPVQRLVERPHAAAEKNPNRHAVVVCAANGPKYSHSLEISKILSQCTGPVAHWPGMSPFLMRVSDFVACFASPSTSEYSTRGPVTALLVLSAREHAWGFTCVYSLLLH